MVGRDVFRRHDRRCRKFREVIELRRQVEALLVGAVAFAGQADEDDKLARWLCRIGLCICLPPPKATKRTHFAYALAASYEVLTIVIREDSPAAAISHNLRPPASQPLLPPLQ